MRRRRRRVGAGTVLFSSVVLILGIAIAVLALDLKDDTRGSAQTDPTTDASSDESSPGSEPVDTHETEPGEDPYRIKVDFSLINEPFAGEWLTHWPATSSVEQLRDVSALMSSLVGRPYGSGALEGVTVILDPGHGGIDGGTVYPATAPHEIVEKEIVLPVAMNVKAQLEALGAEVIMTRTTDEWYSVYYRAAKAGEVMIDKLISELTATEKTLDILDAYEEKFQAIYDLNLDRGGGEFIGGAGTNEDARLLYDLGRQFPDVIFVSIHANSWTDASIGGMQVYYVDNAFQYQFTKTQAGQGDDVPPVYQNFDDAGRLQLANALANQILADVPELTNVGGIQTLKQDGFVVLNRTGLNSVMLEIAYVTNARDRANLLDATFRDRVADSITRGIYNYFCQPTP